MKRNLGDIKYDELGGLLSYKLYSELMKHLIFIIVVFPFAIAYILYLELRMLYTGTAFSTPHNAVNFRDYMIWLILATLFYLFIWWRYLDNLRIRIFENYFYMGKVMYPRNYVKLKDIKKIILDVNNKHVILILKNGRKYTLKKRSYVVKDYFIDSAKEGIREKNKRRIYGWKRLIRVLKRLNIPYEVIGNIPDERLAIFNIDGEERDFEKEVKEFNKRFMEYRKGLGKKPGNLL